MPGLMNRGLINVLIPVRTSSARSSAKQAVLSMRGRRCGRCQRRGDVEAVHPLRRGAAEAMEAIVHGDRKTSRLVGRMIDEVALPEGCYISALVRQGSGQAQVTASFTPPALPRPPMRTWNPRITGCSCT